MSEETTKVEAVARLQQGNSWNKQGESERAIACYRQAIKLDPKLVEAYKGKYSAKHGQIYRSSRILC